MKPSLDLNTLGGHCDLLLPGQLCNTLEILLLGCCVRDNAAGQSIPGHVYSDVFDNARHRAIFQALTSNHWMTLPIADRTYGSHCADQLRQLEKRTHRLAADDFIQALEQQRIEMLGLLSL